MVARLAERQDDRAIAGRRLPNILWDVPLLENEQGENRFLAGEIGVELAHGLGVSALDPHSQGTSPATRSARRDSEMFGSASIFRR